MAIQFIENQPFIFEAPNEYQSCKKDESRCALIQDGDEIYVQMKQTPCTGELLCDTDFQDGTLGDLVTNGDFEGSASGWTISAGEWIYDGTNDQIDYLSVTGTSTLSQTIAEGLVEDECYTLHFTIGNWVSGSLTPSLGGTAGTAVNANGTYHQVITAGAGTDLVFNPGGAGQYSLDDIQLYRTGFCWCPDNGYVTTGEGNLCHVNGLATTVTQVGILPAITSGNLYQVAVTVSGRSAGLVRLLLGTAASDDFEANGTYTDYVIADANNAFSIYFDADFDGCITDVSVMEMETGHIFTITDQDQVGVIGVTGYASYTDDRIILNFPITDLAINKGCYLIKATDGCDAEVYYSNCFNYKASHPGTRQVIATDYITGGVTTRYSFGFMWLTTSFYLIQRLYLNFRRPTSNSKSVTDRFSTGEHFKSYVERSKQWELAVESLDETAHDCLDIQTQLKDWSIDGVKYHRHDEEYAPSWDEGGYNTLADVKLNVSRKTEVLFSDNCNR